MRWILLAALFSGCGFKRITQHDCIQINTGPMNCTHEDVKEYRILWWRWRF